MTLPIPAVVDDPGFDNRCFICWSHWRVFDWSARCAEKKNVLDESHPAIAEELSRQSSKYSISLNSVDSKTIFKMTWCTKLGTAPDVPVWCVTLKPRLILHDSTVAFGFANSGADLKMHSWTRMLLLGFLVRSTQESNMPRKNTGH